MSEELTAREKLIIDMCMEAAAAGIGGQATFQNSARIHDVPMATIIAVAKMMRNHMHQTARRERMEIEGMTE